MARMVTARTCMGVSTAAAWLFGFMIFLPILWNGPGPVFKTELDAFAMAAEIPGVHWTTENYATVAGAQRLPSITRLIFRSIVAGGFDTDLR